jgi:hypothetical protein
MMFSFAGKWMELETFKDDFLKTAICPVGFCFSRNAGP